MNKVMLIGRTTNDIVLQENKNGNTYCYFTLAINNGKDNATFVNCLAWNALATIMNNYVKKGFQIGLEGVLNAYSTKESDGGYKNHYNVVAVKIDLLTQSTDKDNKEESNSLYNQVEAKKAEAKEEEETKIDINFEDIEF